MMISGERTKQLDIFCRISGVMSDFLSFTDVELIRFFHRALQLIVFWMLVGNWSELLDYGQCFSSYVLFHVVTFPGVSEV